MGRPYGQVVGPSLSEEGIACSVRLLNAFGRKATLAANISTVR